ncbi:YqcI/YcgG family protein [Kitasatospora kazusensis]
MPALSISEAQTAVRNMVDNYGGYWHPTSAAFYLYEHVTELDVPPDPSETQSDNIAKHLIEIFVTSICLAGQYSVDLNRAYKDAKYRIELGALADDLRTRRNVDLSELIREIKNQTAEVCRTITFYELDRLPLDALELPSLQEGIPRLHATIVEAFTVMNKSFRSAFREKLRKAADSHRFARHFDPGTASCIDLFRKIQQSSACPFAENSRLWGAPSYESTQSIRENLRSSLPILASFTRVAQKEVLDGFLYAFPVGTFGDDIPSLCKLVKTFVAFLMANDPVGPRTLSRDQILSPEWHFSFDGEDYFVNVFSPCYANDHTRYTHGVRDWIFLILQPDSSFHYRIPPERFDATRRLIREKFDNIYQEYEHQKLEAHRFILPAAHSDPPIAWYDAEEFVENIGGYYMSPDVE